MAVREGGIGGGTGLINSQVAWDLNGNLTRRKDLQQSPNITEDVYYDSLNRFDLSQRTVGTGTPTTNQDVTLDAIGNIDWKMGVGTYAYHATQKRAVISAGGFNFGYDANGNMNSRNGSSIGYTSYNLPNVINAGSSSSAISYGAFRNRYKQVSSGSVAETTIYVAGLLERVTRSGRVTEYRHLIAGGKGIATIYTRRSDATNSTYYVQSDHLGSPELVTDSAGTVIVRLSFGAYGERRDKDWDGPVSAPDLTAIGNTTRHGFTGHEHLDAVGLIHMNGRVYEPIAGRFLGADPIIDGVSSSQGPNAYAYVHNNPLTYVDPSGYSRVANGNQRPLHFDYGNVTREQVFGEFLDEVIVTGRRIPWDPHSITDPASIAQFMQDMARQQGDLNGGEGGGAAPAELEEVVAKGKKVEVQRRRWNAPCIAALRTARQDQAAVHRALNNWAVLRQVTAGTNIDPSLLAAIGVRETGFQNISEQDGAGVGVGVFQLTVSHSSGVTAAQAGNLSFAAAYATNMLSNNMAILGRRFPSFNGAQLLQATAASYNFGIDDISGDPNTIDAGSAHNNYGSNVVALQSCFR